MRPRIFSLMLTAFALVIVLGIGGMAGFFGITVANIQHGRDSVIEEFSALTNSEAQRLGAYYEEHGSWQGVEDVYDDVERELAEANLQPLMLLNADGNPVISGDRSVREPDAAEFPSELPYVTVPEVSMPMEMEHLPGPGRGNFMSQVVQIEYNGHIVGSLVLAVRDGREFANTYFDGRQIFRGFASAGLGLAAILLLLATFFSRRISTPLSKLTYAAQSLA